MYFIYIFIFIHILYIYINKNSEILSFKYSSFIHFCNPQFFSILCLNDDNTNEQLFHYSWVLYGNDHLIDWISSSIYFPVTSYWLLLCILFSVFCFDCLTSFGTEFTFLTFSSGVCCISPLLHDFFPLSSQESSIILLK